MTTNWMGSGNEVESATFHNPIDGGLPTDVSGRSGFRGKLDDLKMRGALIKSNARSGMSNQMTKVQTSMQTSPMKWAGIAAGSGLALGLLGRFLHWRNYHRRTTPDLVIIETSC